MPSVISEIVSCSLPGRTTTTRTNLDAFTKMTGVHIQVNAFGSNEEMLAKLQAGGTGWDVFVPTNYTISNYAELDLIQPMDLARLPNYDGSANDPIFAGPATIDGKVYCVPKNWGTTGFVVNTKKDQERSEIMERLLRRHHGQLAPDIPSSMTIS